jgi:hypothetical protein
VREKRLHFRAPHLLRMALAVEQDKAPRPAAVPPLSANAAMFGAQTRTHPIQQIADDERLQRGGTVGGALSGCYLSYCKLKQSVKCRKFFWQPGALKF